jgi:predicted nucleic acid-binding protein
MMKSIITKIEFLSWSVFSQNENLKQKAVDFISYANIFELNNEIAEKTIKNRQTNKIKTPDAIIAATAKIHNFVLLTNDICDFKNLDIEVEKLN